MGVVMDDETREALEMTPEELAARWPQAEPASIRKHPDFVQRMKQVVDESTAGESEHVVTQAFEYDDEGAFVSTSAPPAGL